MLNNSAGQAILEYILVLILVVVLILGGLYQFNESFRNYAQAFFGDYLACLIETGQVPALGAPASGNNPCNQFVPEFDPESGNPLVESGNSNGNNGNNNGGDGGGETNTGGGGSEGTGGGSDREDQAQYTRAGGGGGGSGGGGDIGDFDRNAGGDGGGQLGNSAGEEDDIYTGSTEASTPPGVNPRGGGSGGEDRFRIVRGFGVAAKEKKEEEEKETIKVKSKVSQQSEESQRIKVERTPAKKEEVDEPEEFDLFDLIRYLIIIGIIIGLVVVLGGQAAQISKSWE